MTCMSFEWNIINNSDCKQLFREYYDETGNFAIKRISGDNRIKVLPTNEYTNWLEKKLAKKRDKI